MKHSEQSHYWNYDYTAPVKYSIQQMDPLFMRFVKKSYGSEKIFFDQVSHLVTMRETERTVKSHPTGGRAGVYDLPSPFVDPQTQLPCYEVGRKRNRTDYQWVYSFQK